MSSEYQRPDYLQALIEGKYTSKMKTCSPLAMIKSVSNPLKAWKANLEYVIQDWAFAKVSPKGRLTCDVGHLLDLLYFLRDHPSCKVKPVHDRGNFEIGRATQIVKDTYIELYNEDLRDIYLNESVRSRMIVNNGDRSHWKFSVDITGMEGTNHAGWVIESPYTRIPHPIDGFWHYVNEIYKKRVQPIEFGELAKISEINREQQLDTIKNDISNVEKAKVLISRTSDKQRLVQSIICDLDRLIQSFNDNIEKVSMHGVFDIYDNRQLKRQKVEPM